jgi:hypothetical protein
MDRPKRKKKNEVAVKGTVETLSKLEQEATNNRFSSQIDATKPQPLQNNEEESEEEVKPTPNIFKKNEENPLKNIPSKPVKKWPFEKNDSSSPIPKTPTTPTTNVEHKATHVETSQHEGEVEQEVEVKPQPKVFKTTQNAPWMSEIKNKFGESKEEKFIPQKKMEEVDAEKKVQTNTETLPLWKQELAKRQQNHLKTSQETKISSVQEVKPVLTKEIPKKSTPKIETKSPEKLEKNSQITPEKKISLDSNLSPSSQKPETKPEKLPPQVPLKTSSLGDHSTVESKNSNWPPKKMEVSKAPQLPLKSSTAVAPINEPPSKSLPKIPEKSSNVTVVPTVGTKPGLSRTPSHDQKLPEIPKPKVLTNDSETQPEVPIPKKEFPIIKMGGLPPKPKKPIVEPEVTVEPTPVVETKKELPPIKMTVPKPKLPESVEPVVKEPKKEIQIIKMGGPPPKPKKPMVEPEVIVEPEEEPQKGEEEEKKMKEEEKEEIPEEIVSISDKEIEEKQEIQLMTPPKKGLPVIKPKILTDYENQSEVIPKKELPIIKMGGPPPKPKKPMVEPEVIVEPTPVVETKKELPPIKMTAPKPKLPEATNVEVKKELPKIASKSKPDFAEVEEDSPKEPTSATSSTSDANDEFMNSRDKPKTVSNPNYRVSMISPSDKALQLKMNQEKSTEKNTTKRTGTIMMMKNMIGFGKSKKNDGKPKFTLPEEYTTKKEEVENTYHHYTQLLNMKESYIKATKDLSAIEQLLSFELAEYSVNFKELEMRQHEDTDVFTKIHLMASIMKKISSNHKMMVFDPIKSKKESFFNNIADIVTMYEDGLKRINYFELIYQE